MGQGEIIKALEEKDWMTVKELSKVIRSNKSTISSAIVRLFRNNEIMRKDVKTNTMGRTYEYAYSLTPHMREKDE